jgi:hypothetical protein
MRGVGEFWAYWGNNVCIQEMVRLSAGAVGGGGGERKSWVEWGYIRENEFRMDTEVTELGQRLKKSNVLLSYRETLKYS